MKLARRRFFKACLVSPVALAAEAMAAQTWQRIGSGTASLSASANRVRQISTSSGAYASLLLRTDGKVAGVGQTTSGALGTTSTPVSSLSTFVSGLSNVQSIAMGGLHQLSLLSDGTVRATGENGTGQLGNASTTDVSSPVTVLGMSNVRAVAAAGDSTAPNGYSLFLRSNGTVWSCGYNGYGQLGDGTTSSRSSAVQMTGVSNIAAISAGLYHCLLLTAAGRVYASGYGANGRLGNLLLTNVSSPYLISTLGLPTNIVAVAAGGSHSLFLSADGTVWGCGAGTSGQLGNSLSIDSILTAVKMTGISNAVAIAAGYRHSVVVTADGNIWSCGDNSNGTLGQGDTTNRNSPVQLVWQSNITAVAAGRDFSLYLGSDGTVAAVGDNSQRQIGDGSANDRLFGTNMSIGWT